MYKDLRMIWSDGRKKLYVNDKGNVVKPILKDIHKPFSIGNIDWHNLIIGNWLSLLIVFCLLFSAYGYKHDTGQCYKILEHPCSYAYSIQCQGCLQPLDSNEFKPRYASSDWSQFNYTIEEINLA